MNNNSAVGPKAQKILISGLTLGGDNPLSFEPKNATVFVGPNNSGKSLLLNEITSICLGNPIKNKVLSELRFANFTEEEAKEELSRVLIYKKGDDEVVVGRKGESQHVRPDVFQKFLQLGDRRMANFYVRYLTLALTGSERLRMLGEETASVPQPWSSVGGTLNTLFWDEEKLNRLSNLIYGAFGRYPIIDCATNAGKLILRLSDVLPPKDFEKSISREAFEFFGKATVLEEFSDGVRSYTGILSQFIGSDPGIVTIDEPEAFLHPSLAFSLGKELCAASASSNKQLIASTHSPHFLMGCIQSGADVNIVRLTYQNGKGNAMLLPSEELLPMMRNPLLRSVGVIESLFYKSVIVTEADADRAFYQEINERLLAANDARGIPDCRFLNAQNKQTIGSIVEPLRGLGIPAAGIVDIDVIRDGGKVWTGFLKSVGVATTSHQPYGAMREVLARDFERVAGAESPSVETAADAATKVRDKAGKLMKQSGVSLLSSDAQSTAVNLFHSLDDHGLFVVREGELECWLPQLAANGHTPQWLIEVFEKMGADPRQPNYLKPGDGDVWEFIGKIKKWLHDPDRRGLK